MHLEHVASGAPDRPAVVLGDVVISFRELADRANRLARLFRDRGLERGDVVAIFMENNARFLEVAWAAQQSGLYYTTINSHITVEEATYIVQDSGARLLVTSAALAGLDVANRILRGATPQRVAAIA